MKKSMFQVLKENFTPTIFLSCLWTFASLLYHRHIIGLRIIIVVQRLDYLTIFYHMGVMIFILWSSLNIELIIFFLPQSFVFFLGLHSYVCRSLDINLFAVFFTCNFLRNRDFLLLFLFFFLNNQLFFRIFLLLHTIPHGSIGTRTWLYLFCFLGSLDILILVIIIIFEQLLKFGLSQKQAVFFNHGRLLLVFDGYLLVLIEIFLLHQRNKRRLYLFGIEPFPIYGPNPWMGLYLLNSMKPKSILRFPLDQSIHKIGSLKAPSFWDLACFYLCLFG